MKATLLVLGLALTTSTLGLNILITVRRFSHSVPPLLLIFYKFRP